MKKNKLILLTVLIILVLYCGVVIFVTKPDSFAYSAVFGDAQGRVTVPTSEQAEAQAKAERDALLAEMERIASEKAGAVADAAVEKAVAQADQNAAKAIDEAMAKAVAQADENAAKAINEAVSKAMADATESVSKAIDAAIDDAVAKAADSVSTMIDKAVDEAVEKAVAEANENMGKAIDEAITEAEKNMGKAIDESVAEAEAEINAKVKDAIAKAIEGMDIQAVIDAAADGIIEKAVAKSIQEFEAKMDSYIPQISSAVAKDLLQYEDQFAQEMYAKYKDQLVDLIVDELLGRIESSASEAAPAADAKAETAAPADMSKEEYDAKRKEIKDAELKKILDQLQN